MTTPLFLDADELRTLTGYSIKAKQIEQLRTMGVPFRVNGCGRPVVTRVAVEGAGGKADTSVPEWKPGLLQFDRKAA